jgi:hypothetical protein
MKLWFFQGLAIVHREVGYQKVLHDQAVQAGITENVFSEQGFLMVDLFLQRTSSRQAASQCTGDVAVIALLRNTIIVASLERYTLSFVTTGKNPS